MKKIRLGTRKSELAVAQAELVKKTIERELGYEVTLIKQESIGDRDQVSQLHSFRGQGVFTGTLERAMLNNEIDIAVHSLKDLPVHDTSGLYLPALINRHSPGDILLIKEQFLLDDEPPVVSKGLRFATGSPRRQSQFLAAFPDSIPVDIRGNVNTRVSRLNTGFIDALIMAKAVFERIDLPLPPHVRAIDLPIQQFPGAPGQGAIAVQARVGELEELASIGDEDTKLAVTSEREILSQIGGGCDIAVGLSIHKKGMTWELYCTQPQQNWDFSKKVSMQRMILQHEDIDELKHLAINHLHSTQKDEIDISDKGHKRVVLVRSIPDSMDYQQEIEQHPSFTVFPMPVFSYHTHYSVLDDAELKEKWESATWVVLSSQRAAEMLRLLHRLHPRKAYRVAVVGMRTAKIVRSHGLPVNLVARGSLADLQGDLAEAREIYPGDVLFLSGEHITGLPTEDAHRSVVYSVQNHDIDLPFTPDFMVLFSRRSAIEVIKQLGTHASKHWVALGASTAEYLKSQNIDARVAKTPTPRGILQALLSEEN